MVTRYSEPTKAFDGANDVLTEALHKTSRKCTKYMVGKMKGDGELKSISLYRKGAKEWSCDGHVYTRVEAATLNYFRAEGYEGFDCSNGFSPMEVLLVAIAWPKKFRPFPQMVHWGSSIIGNSSTNPLRLHKFSLTEVLKAINRNASFGRPLERLKELEAADIKNKLFLCGTGRIDAAKLYDFFRFGGAELVQEFIKPYASQREDDLIFLHNMFSCLQQLPALTYDFSSAAAFYRYALPFWYESILTEASKIRFLEMVGLCGYDHLEVLDVAERCRQKAQTGESFREALLDLWLWKDGSLIEIEVKAPGDRLRPNQKRHLEFLRRNNRKYFIVEISERD